MTSVVHSWINMFYKKCCPSLLNLVSFLICITLSFNSSSQPPAPSHNLNLSITLQNLVLLCNISTRTATGDDLVCVELIQLEMVPITASGSKVQPGLSKARLLLALEIRICVQDPPQRIKRTVFRALSL